MNTPKRISNANFKRLCCNYHYYHINCAWVKNMFCIFFSFIRGFLQNNKNYNKFNNCIVVERKRKTLGNWTTSSRTKWKWYMELKINKHVATVCPSVITCGYQMIRGSVLIGTLKKNPLICELSAICSYRTHFPSIYEWLMTFFE